MNTPLTEKDLYRTLSGYASTLEVRYMIEEEVQKFQSKVLPQLIRDAVQCSSGTAGSGEALGRNASTVAVSTHGTPASSPASTASVSHASQVHGDVEWVQTFLKAHVDDTLGRSLPFMISHEVQRQLRAAGLGASDQQNLDVGTAAPSAHLRSPPRGDATATASLSTPKRVCAGLPPLPPSPPPPLSASTSVVSPDRAAAGKAPPTASVTHRKGGGVDSTEVTVPATSTPAAHEEGRRQRDRILRAIADIEHQLNEVQRDVSEVSLQQRLSRSRLAFLCESLQLGGEAEAGDASLEGAALPLFAALANALDNRQALAVRACLTKVLQELIPVAKEAQHGPPAGRSTDAVSIAPVDAPELLQSPLRKDIETPRRASPPPLGGPLWTTVNATGSSLPSTLPPTRNTSPSCEPAPPLSVGPVALGTRWTAGHAYPSHVESVTAAVPAETAAATPIGRTAAVRTLTTRGTAQSRTPSLSSSSARVPGVGTSAASPSPPPVLRPSLRKAQEGTTPPRFTAFLRPAVSSPRAGATPRPRGDEPLREKPSADDVTTSAMVAQRNSFGAAAAASATARPAALASPPLELGIDAMNIPRQMLPEILGEAGAVRVQSVAPHKLAEHAGICRGDVLLSVDHHTVSSCDELREVLAAIPSTQDDVAVELYRHPQQQIITLAMHVRSM